MDPITSLISGYILSISSGVQDSYSKSVNLDLTPVSIEYKNTNISFQHQMWRIKEKSICASYKKTPIEFANCTTKAKSLFAEICTELSKRKQRNNFTSNYQRMYCNASVDFKPMVASISSGSSTKITENEKLCNQLILQTMNNKDEKLIEKRNQTCGSK